MKIRKTFVGIISLICINAQAQNIESWITLPDKTKLLQKETLTTTFEKASTTNTLPTIIIDETKTFQKMDGFGFMLTSGSATLLHQMDAIERKKLLNELFGMQENSISISYLRISVGASDLSEKAYSYDDIEKGRTDVLLKNFSLAEDKKDLIPVLKEILAINPKIKLMATPWSPPVWMKTNENSIGGSLKPEFYEVYAKYLVKYIQEMKKEGILIDAMTIQNEPLHPGNNPSLLMYPYEQADFIKKSLGPAFQKAAIKTKILIYDHNADRPDYPIQVLNDLAAKKFIDGTAFHLYGGSVEAIGEVHEVHPDKNLYFTEQWTGSKGSFDGDLNWHIRTLIIGASRNWCKTVLEWNLANDPLMNPHTDGGCTECLGALTIDGNKVTRNVSYYIIGHASKLVEPNSTRIFSNSLGDISNVVFKTPNGKIVLIAQNESDKEKTTIISYKNKQFTYTFPKKAVVTFVW